MMKAGRILLLAFLFVFLVYLYIGRIAREDIRAVLTRECILKSLKNSAKSGKPIIGVAVGAGIFAKYAEAGGADLLLVLNSGRFRLMGRSSLAGLMPYANSNKMVMEFGKKEVLNIVKSTPVIFGLCATDPTIELNQYIKEIHSSGFSGINNFPTVGIIDGEYGKALEYSGISYSDEVRAISIARENDIFTIAFVFDEDQAKKMIDAGADVICVHLGFTKGGVSGVKSSITLEGSVELTQRIFDCVNSYDKNIIKLVYGGPVNTPETAEYIYERTDAMGYIGGSSFERIPTEEAVTHITEMFKNFHSIKEENRSLREQLNLFNAVKEGKYVEYILEYIKEHYTKNICLNDLADRLHLSRNYLSFLFKKEVGCSFSSYLVNYRVEVAKRMMSIGADSIHDISVAVGYNDPAYFSRLFKKVTGLSPSQFIRLRRDFEN